MAGSSNFRRDIQGLRALAVAAVVIFHVWPEALPGGYVGVDVFFVISGYLITGLLLREQESNGRINLAGFYARRIRRLLPVASVTLLCTCVAAAFLMSPTEFGGLAREVIASAFYVENWLLVNRSVDYLAQDVAPSPVQHFWSLSVEEQFYIFWPALMLLAAAAGRRCGWQMRRSVGAALVLVLLCSLAHGIHVSFTDPAPGYFLTSTRVWELAMGGVLALMPLAAPGRVGGRIAGWLGFSLILVACVFYTNRLPFPGYEALLPVVGAMLLLHARLPSEGVLGRMLGSPPAQYLGELSYSIYLWHWPLVVFYPLLTGRAVAHLQDGVVVVLLSIGLAHISKHFIEDRFRHGVPGERIRPWVVGGVFTLAVVAGAFSLQQLGARGGAAKLAGDATTTTAGPGDPMTARNDLAAAYAENCIAPSRGEDVRVCRYGDPKGRPVVAVGDSHMVHWLPALSAIARERGIDLHAITKTGCALMTLQESEVDTPERRSCAVWNAAAMRYIADLKPKAMIVANSSGATHMLGPSPDKEARVAERMARSWKQAREQAGVVDILAFRETPRMREDPPECIRLNKGDGAACSYPQSGAVGGSLVELAAGQVAGVTVVNMNDVICPGGVCAPVVNGVYVWRDKHHLTASFVESIEADVSKKMANKL